MASTPPKAASAAGPAPRTTSKSPLLSLPAELRIEIFTHLLYNPSIDITNFVVDRERYRQWRERAISPLLLTSQQVRFEALTVFASCNTFSVTSPLSLVYLLHDLGPIGRTSVRRVDLTIPGAINPVDASMISAVLPLLHECGKLRLRVLLRAKLLSLSSFPWKAPLLPWRAPHFQRCFRHHRHLRALLGRAEGIGWLDEQPLVPRVLCTMGLVETWVGGNKSATVLGKRGRESDELDAANVPRRRRTVSLGG